MSHSLYHLLNYYKRHFMSSKGGYQIPGDNQQPRSHISETRMFPITSALAVLFFLLLSYLLNTYPSFSSATDILSSFTALLPSFPVSRTSAINYTAFIPFVPSSLTPDELPWTNPVRIPWCLDHQPYCYTGILDTGSTGVLLSAADLTNYNRSLASVYPIGWEFLTSSKILYIGNWIPRNLTFPTGTKNSSTNITANVPILAVTKKVICPGYNIKKDGPECPPSANGTGEIDMPVHIVYLGVGFGRQYNGKPQGTPDKNPFLNIVAINDEPVPQMHEGYIITDEGIHIGLTDENSKRFQRVKLTKQTAYSDDDRDWAQTGSCISVAKDRNNFPDSECVNGTMLVDTGVAQMYLTIPPSIPVIRIRKESPSRPGTDVSVLTDDQIVDVDFGNSASRESMEYSGYMFFVGHVENEVAPTQVITTVSNITAPFVNTGRHLLRRYNVLFDARDGWYGVRYSVRWQKENKERTGDWD